MRLKSKRSRACDIPYKVKKAVWIRDRGRCIFCGSHYAMPTAHYVSRANGGLGVEQNILTLCNDCHRRYDQTTDRKALKEFFTAYLKSQYVDWDESKLYYKKGISDD